MASAPANTRKNGRVPNAGPPGGGIEPTVGANANVPTPSTGVRLRKRKIVQNVNDGINIKMRERANARIAAAAAAAAPPASNVPAPDFSLNGNGAAAAAAAPAPRLLIPKNLISAAGAAGAAPGAPPASNLPAPTFGAAPAPLPLRPMNLMPAAAPGAPPASNLPAPTFGAAPTDYPREAQLKLKYKMNPVPIMFNVKNGNFMVSIPRTASGARPLEICSPSLKGIRDKIAEDAPAAPAGQPGLMSRMFGKRSGGTRRHRKSNRKNTRKGRK
jgi:hypothetical protein